MGVDTTLQFGRYNSYQLAAGEELWSSKFNVDLYSHIAIQLQVVRTASTSTGQLIVRWIKADGTKLSDSTKTISIPTRWTRETWALEVPELAVSAMWAVKNTHASRAWNFACGMVEPGPLAGAFDPAFANQVSLLDAWGLYTGTVTANQVETGLLRSTDGRAWFDLDKPEIVMQGDGATWKASPGNPIRLEDDDGELIGGLVRLPDGVLATLAGVLTNKEQPDFFLNTGTFTDSESNTHYGLIGRGSDGRQLFRLGSMPEETADDNFSIVSKWLEISGRPHPLLSSTPAPFVEILTKNRSGVTPQYPSAITMTDWYISLVCTSDELQGKLSIYPGNAYVGIGTNALGVDATGPYYTVNNEQSRLNSVNLSAGTNLNTVTVPGVYYTGSSAQTNKPSGAGDYAMLQVIKNSATFITQFYVDGSSDAWVRRMHSGTWAAWKKLT